MPAYTATSVAYYLVGELTAGTGHQIATALDDAIPFVPVLALGYMTMYLLPFVLVLAIREVGQLRVTIVAYAILSAISFAIYLTYPVDCPKPQIDRSTISGRVLALEHWWDTPMNSLPSMHASVALLVYYCCRGINRRLSIALAVLAGVIGVSAIAVKQHYVADIVTGFALAWFSYRVALALVARRKQRA